MYLVYSKNSPRNITKFAVYSAADSQINHNNMRKNVYSSKLLQSYYCNEWSGTTKVVSGKFLPENSHPEQFHPSNSLRWIYPRKIPTRNIPNHAFMDFVFSLLSLLILILLKILILIIFYFCLLRMLKSDFLRCIKKNLQLADQNSYKLDSSGGQIWWSVTVAIYLFVLNVSYLWSFSWGVWCYVIQST